MTRPIRKIVPPSRFADDSDDELTPHHGANTSLSVASATSSPLPQSSPPQTDMEDALSLTADPSQTQSSSKCPSHTIQASVSLDSVIVVSPTTSDGASPAIPIPKTKKLKTSLTSGD
ncbi:hypothetical protein EI94DRAFT_1701466 [Lactarius quietus]|nr:hypothetical protein EI94DRAFT_1701466 [Lactarius quietus]